MPNSVESSTKQEKTSEGNESSDKDRRINNVARFQVSDTEVSLVRVYLNGKFVPIAVAADEDEGWVDIWDIDKMAPLELEDSELVPVETDEDPNSLPPLQEVPVRRLFGKVELVGKVK
jgi:hypothetical protein